MNKNVKVRITGDGVREFFDRAREHARKLDRGEELAPEITVSFENASDMMRVLSAQRIRLLHVARKKATPMSDLAVGLKRDTRAVGRDVDLLERFGLLRTRYENNAGHGKRRIVESRVAKYQLISRGSCATRLHNRNADCPRCHLAHVQTTKAIRCLCTPGAQTRA